MADRKSALNRRHDQLQRWAGSELDKAATTRNYDLNKIKFDDGCVFLASCASEDIDEVKVLLDRGTDINTANIDGLTALHQAVIDEKLDMVEFLVENGADIEMQDNEGWTSLHAAASCGFADIVTFLIDNGADLVAVNNDGELPLDLAEEDEIQEILERAVDKQGLDVELARNEEENKMLSDANQWINSKIVKEKKHSKSGASALHVAASKGYIKVMNLLIQAGVNINDQDFDGWTALHAAAHWGQKEAAEVLVENLADMEKKNKLGATCFDVADEDMLKWLEELKKKQASMKKDDKPAAPRIQGRAPPPLKRRSSVSRISVSQKEILMHQDMSVERKKLEEKIHGKDENKEAVNNIDKVREAEKNKERKYDESESSSSEDESSEEDKPKSNKPPPTPSKKEDGRSTESDTSRPQYMTPTTEDTESETQRRTRARRERASRRSTQGVTAEDIESAENLVGKSDKDTNKKEEEKETTGYTRRSRRTDDNEVSTTRPSSGISSRYSSTTTSSYSRPSASSSYSRPSSTSSSYSSTTRPSSTSSYRPSSSYTPSSYSRRY